ncbi:hypothetical protein ACU6QH_00455, partial [Aeromonas veronii]|uniref:hypothetical protein n=1 Tax=Aeromonas veronii TaxID=654 RepID=UPI00406CCF94
MAQPAGRQQGARRAAANRAASLATAPKPTGDTTRIPLNTNAIAASASRLGLAVREVPATVEVISAET